MQSTTLMKRSHEANYIHIVMDQLTNFTKAQVFPTTRHPILLVA